MGLVLSAGPGLGVHRALRRDPLAHGNRLAGQQGFIHHEVVALGQQGVGGRPLALLQHQQIPPRHLDARDALARPIADHQGARARQAAQGLQHALGAGLLHDGDDDGDEREGEEDQRLLQIAQQQIEQAAAQQQRQHGLAQHVEHDAEGRAPISGGRLVAALRRKPRLRFDARQAREGFRHDHSDARA